MRLLVSLAVLAACGAPANPRPTTPPPVAAAAQPVRAEAPAPEPIHLARVTAPSLAPAVDHRFQGKACDRPTRPCGIALERAVPAGSGYALVGNIYNGFDWGPLHLRSRNGWRNPLVIHIDDSPWQRVATSHPSTGFAEAIADADGNVIAAGLAGASGITDATLRLDREAPARIPDDGRLWGFVASFAAADGALRWRTDVIARGETFALRVRGFAQGDGGTIVAWASFESVEKAPADARLAVEARAGNGSSRVVEGVRGATVLVTIDPVTGAWTDVAQLDVEGWVEALAPTAEGAWIVFARQSAEGAWERKAVRIDRRGTLVPPLRAIPGSGRLRVYRTPGVVRARADGGLAVLVPERENVRLTVLDARGIPVLDRSLRGVPEDRLELAGELDGRLVLAVRNEVAANTLVLVALDERGVSPIGAVADVLSLNQVEVVGRELVIVTGEHSRFLRVPL